MAGDSHTTRGGDGARDGDPRLSAEYVRTIEPSGADGADRRELGEVTLVGVVHDHPASAYRARTLTATIDPDVLALELPPLAVPLFERYASGEETERADAGGNHREDATGGDRPLPATGGEMSAAIQAADVDRTAGIDGPTLGFATRLGRQLAAEDASAGTARTAVGRFLRASGHAATCRLAATVSAVTGREPPELSAPRTHAVEASDAATEQAQDEHRQVRLARSVAAAFGADRAVATRDATREAHMAERLESLAVDGDVVAVVGVDHLDPVAQRLGVSD